MQGAYFQQWSFQYQILSTRSNQNKSGDLGIRFGVTSVWECVQGLPPLWSRCGRYGVVMGPLWIQHGRYVAVVDPRNLKKADPIAENELPVWTS